MDKFVLKKVIDFSLILISSSMGANMIWWDINLPRHDACNSTNCSEIVHINRCFPFVHSSTC